MTYVNIEGFTTLKQKVKTMQNQLPTDSLDWSIYQRQLDLLSEVESLFDVQLQELATSDSSTDLYLRVRQ